VECDTRHLPTVIHDDTLDQSVRDGVEQRNTV